MIKLESDSNTNGWFKRLKSGLSKSSTKVVSGISSLFTEKKLDDVTLEELEDLLITSDLGVAAASEMTRNLAAKKFDHDINEEDIRISFASDIANILKPFAQPIEIDPSLKPHVVLVCGVNGSGKTTTIGKLAQQWADEGKKVCLAAGDTFRAAAIEQLQVWGQRAGVPVITHPQGSDPAALAFDAVGKCIEDQIDILLIDTAGRLQNRSELMDELAKIVRVIKKQIPEAPHDCLLILDGTVGQNAHNQVSTFLEMINVTGLVVTKLDGSTRGGVIVSLAKKFELPVHAIGVGESAQDLRAFSPEVFAKSLMGLD